MGRETESSHSAHTYSCRGEKPLRNRMGGKQEGAYDDTDSVYEENLLP